MSFSTGRALATVVNPDGSRRRDIGTKLEGDLKLLQGTWQVSDVGVAADQPGAAEMIAASKEITLTVEDDILSMVTPGGAAISSIKLDSTKEPKTIDLIPLEGGGRKTGLGIYSLAGDSWALCISFRGAARPTEMLFNKDLDHALLTLKKETVPTIDESTAATLRQKVVFFKAWQQASAKLQAMKVRASLEQWEQFAGIEGPTHAVVLTLPETADGAMSPELWAIVSSISHVAVVTTFATDATLRQVAQHPGLLGINMDIRATVTADGIGALKSCPQLRSLMFHVPISPELCKAISQLDQLRFFGISNSPVTKEMLSSIVRLNQLERLSLYNTGVTDENALQIQALAKLKYLTLSQSSVTDQGLKTLASLKDLESLNLEQTKVTDVGLKSLESLRGLKLLFIRGLNVTPQAVAAFEASSPNCKVMK